jgi:hypothetical protein
MFVKPLPFAVDYLKKILKYNPHTGDFFWIQDRANGQIKAGSKAGGPRRNKNNGLYYWRIYIDKKEYGAHRLAYFMYYGKDPYPYDIDHKDRNSLNNSIDNLREATPKQNNQNRGRFKNNTSGLAGIYLLPSGRWEVRIEDKRIGTYLTKDEAILERLSAEQNTFGDCSSSG